MFKIASTAAPSLLAMFPAKVESLTYAPRDRVVRVARVSEGVRVIIKLERGDIRAGIIRVD